MRFFSKFSNEGVWSEITGYTHVPLCSIDKVIQYKGDNVVILRLFGGLVIGTELVGEDVINLVEGIDKGAINIDD